LPGRNAWQSGEGIKKYENSSKKTAAILIYPSIRLGERTLFKEKIQQNLFSSSLPTSHPSEYTEN
jgi:hypothetical protein